MKTKLEKLQAYIDKINARENGRIWPIMVTMCEVILEQQKQIDRLEKIE